MNPEGICAKLNKSDRKKKMLYDLTYIWKLKKANSETKNRLPDAGKMGRFWSNSINFNY